MEVAENTIKYTTLQGFVPLDALTDSHLRELANNAITEEITAGQYIFRAGDRDDETVYLLAGVVELVNTEGEVVSRLSEQSTTARHPLAHAQPRQLSVRVVEKASIVRIESTRLDALLAWSESTGYSVEEITADKDDDWLTRLLQSETFSRLSPINIQQLLSRMESIPVSAGDVVVEEGSSGEYFYVVQQGRLAVTRRGAVEDRDVLLAELSAGSCFGEEALVAGTQRNATVTMLTDGMLKRVSRQDFDALLRVPLVQSVDYKLAKQAVEKGAQWLDVRLAVEYRNCALPGSLNVPLSEIRDRLDELDRQSRYIICCDNGRRSASAAFVLSQHGFDATALESGMMEVPWEDLDEAAQEGELDKATAEDTESTISRTQDVESQQASLAESAAAAAVVSDFQTKLEQLEAENSRLSSELESVRLELRHQTDEMAQIVKDKQDSISSLETARAALARTQNEQQNTLNQQTRMTHRLRALENEHNQLRHDYEVALAKSGSSLDEVELQASLKRDLAEARQQLEQATAEIAQLQITHEQLLKERDARIKSLETALESERDAVQQQLDELTAAAEAESQQQLAAMQTSMAAGQHTAAEKEQEISELRLRLEQMTNERDGSQAAVQQVRQEADKLRAELEVSRGLDAMEVDAAAPDLQETITQLQTELDAETAQRVLAEKEVTRWKAEAQSLQQAVQDVSETEVVATPVMYTTPPAADREASLITPVSATPDSEPVRQVSTGELIDDDDLLSEGGSISKWKLLLAMGAIAGAAVLYWLPDFGKQVMSPVETKSLPANTKQADSAGASGTAPVAAPVKPADKDVQQLDAEVAPETETVAADSVSTTVAEAVAAIEAIEATAKAPVEEALLEEPVTPQKPASKMSPGKLFSDQLADGSRGPRMVQIPAGSFIMGSTVSSANFSERPQHEVEMSAFAIGKYEITFDEYDRFARATGREFPADAGWGRGRQPVINISWDDAVAYTHWLSQQTGFNYRLPTEAEWEYAARAGTVTRFWWGNDPAATAMANCFDCGSRWDEVKPAAVGSLPANSVGLHEIAGNVMEWVQDCYMPDYQIASTVGAAVNLTPCDAHVVRGGSYSSPLDTLRSAARSRRVPQSRIDNLGFRVVRAN